MYVDFEVFSHFVILPFESKKVPLLASNFESVLGIKLRFKYILKEKMEIMKFCKSSSNDKLYVSR